MSVPDVRSSHSWNSTRKVANQDTNSLCHRTRLQAWHVAHSFLVHVLVALGRSEWFNKVVVSATLPVGLTPAVMVAKPVPA